MFSESRKGSRQLLEEFITCYQSEPCLWNTKSKEYHDKGRKHAAYAKLLRIYKILEPRADRITVVKKINILRTNHRKEKRKVEESKRSGNGNYVPRLWYYYLFNFLENQNNIAKRNYNANGKYNGSAEQKMEIYVDEASVSQDSHSSKLTPENHSPGKLPEKPIAPCMQNSQSPQITSLLDLQISSRKPQVTSAKRNASDSGEDINYRDQDNTSKKPKWGEDRYQLFATNVTLKMKDIRNDTQRLLAEKMINEALFMAEMGQLSMAHSISLSQNYYAPQPPTYDVGRTELSYHNKLNNKQQTSTFATKKEIVMTSPDCTSHYQNEERQPFNCSSCGRPNTFNLEENENSKNSLLSKN